MWKKAKFIVGIANFLSFLFMVFVVFIYLYFVDIYRRPPLPGIAIILLVVFFLSGYYLLKRNREYTRRQLYLIGFLELGHALFILPFGWMLYSNGYRAMVDQYGWLIVTLFICQSFISIASIYFFESNKR